MRSAFVKETTPATPPAAAAPRKNRAGRIALHLSLGLTFATAGSAFMIWPQWMEMDGARTALEIQQSRERELTERLEAVRSMQGRLRSWDQEARRVLLPEELASYSSLVQAVAQREGAQVLGVKVTQRPSPRWRSLALHAASWSDEDGPAGEVQPRAVRVVVSGSFNSVYRSISSLCEQQLLFIPDRWTLVPTPGAPATGTLRPAALGAASPAPGTGERQLRAEIWATVFVVQDPEEKPKAPVNSGPIAANLPADVTLEGVQ